VGKDKVGAGGVVREPGLRAEAVSDVAAHALTLGLGTVGVTASPLPGPSGNVEYFLWMRAGAAPLDPDALARAVEEGPR
jgi:23S rRNA (cytidine1920-2'-O)/16S rRNA (cytidine1409-2'-O)-methyltransferase